MLQKYRIHVNRALVHLNYVFFVSSLYYSCIWWVIEKLKLRTLKNSITSRFSMITLMIIAVNYFIFSYFIDFISCDLFELFTPSEMKGRCSAQLKKSNVENRKKNALELRHHHK